MGNAVTENLRVRSAITEALFRLMVQKSFSEISISDIVRTAGVARASFYRNFENREAVIDGFLRTLHDEIIANPFRELSIQTFSRELLIRQLEYSFTCILRQKNHILLLCDNGFSAYLQELADEYVTILSRKIPYWSANRYLLYCISGASLNMIIHWLRDGAQESPRELAIACAEFFMKSRNIYV